jgi:pimeloyl-ACP methyl ester carboxylesterase
MLNTRIGMLRNARPDAEIEVVPGAGHWLFYEAADWFNDRFRDIIAR